MDATCVECGNTFHTRRPGVAKYCTQACKWLARKAKDGIPCEICGQPTGWTVRSGKSTVIHKACGRHTCGTIASYKRGCRCDSCRAANNADCLAYQRSRPKVALVRQCMACGVDFNPRANQILCSPACRQAKLGRYGDHRSRATFWAVEYERIDRAVLFERDGWTCGVCKLPVDPAAEFPDAGAATIDHIIPMSRGGGHVWTNVQLAHFYCNTAKGNRDLELADAV